MGSGGRALEMLRGRESAGEVRLEGREVQERDMGPAASRVIPYPCARLRDGIVLEMLLRLEQGDCSCTLTVPERKPGIPCPGVPKPRLSL